MCPALTGEGARQVEAAYPEIIGDSDDSLKMDPRRTSHCYTHCYYGDKQVSAELKTDLYVMPNSTFLTFAVSCAGCIHLSGGFNKDVRRKNPKA